MIKKLEKVGISFDVASNKIGWAIGIPQINEDDYIHLQGGTIILSNDSQMQEMSFTPKQERKFKCYLIPQMAKIIKLMKEYDVELVLLEMSTHGGHSQMLNQYNGFFKSLIWLAQIKKVLRQDIEFKSTAASSWQKIVFPELWDKMEKAQKLNQWNNLKLIEKDSKDSSLKRTLEKFNINCFQDDDLADSINMLSCWYLIFDKGIMKVMKFEENKKAKRIRSNLKINKGYLKLNRDLIYETIKSVSSEKKYTKKAYDEMVKNRELIPENVINLLSNEEIKKPLKIYNSTINKIIELESQVKRL